MGGCPPSRPVEARQLCGPQRGRAGVQGCPTCPAAGRLGGEGRGGLSSSQTLCCRVPTAFWNPAASQEGAECQGLREFPPSHLPAGARARLYGISAGCGHQGPLPKARPGFLRPGACCLVAAFVNRCPFPVLTVLGLSAFTGCCDPQGGPTEEIVPPPPAAPETHVPLGKASVVLEAERVCLEMTLLTAWEPPFGQNSHPVPSVCSRLRTLLRV